jgi:heptosyltransferase-2
VGDAIMTIPALRELRRIFADARLTLMVRPQLVSLFAEAEFVDDVLRDESTKLSGLTRAVKEIKSRSFDLAILFPNSFPPALMLFAARVPGRWGYRTQGRGLLLTHPVAPNQELKREHQVFYYLNLVSALEQAMTGQNRVNFAHPNLSLAVSHQRREQARAFLSTHGVSVEKRLAVINPGATNSRAKRWLPERFAAVADHLLARGDTEVVFIGTKDERDIAEQVAGAMRRKPVVLTGQTDLAELVAILSCAHLLISNDTGPAHIGAAVGVPTLTIFGPTEHFATRPFSPSAVVIRKPVECSPCMLRDCPIDHRCMTGITVDDVLAQANEALQTPAPVSLSTHSL